VGVGGGRGGGGGGGGDSELDNISHGIQCPGNTQRKGGGGSVGHTHTHTYTRTYTHTHTYACREWLVPLTSLAGFGDAGEWYGVAWPGGEIYKVSGLTQTLVGDVATLLDSLSR